MHNKEILEKAMALKLEDRLLIIEGLIKSLDDPDMMIEDIWGEEAEKRLKVYRKGRLGDSYGTNIQGE
jgi:hypothetical protein